MSSKPDLVAQLYRVDWTRLSLAATITWRRDHALSQQLWQRRMDQRWPLSPARPPIRWSIDDDPDVAAADAIERRILVAPGGRYRVLADDNLTTVCDGEYRWDIDGNTADRGPAGLSPSAAFGGLLTPRWLIAYYDLEILAETGRGGRPAYQIVATPRALELQRGHGRYHLLDRIDVLVDTALGIIVRSEQIFAGQTLEVAELTDLVIDPPQIHNPPLAPDPSLFRPPPGMSGESEPDDDEPDESDDDDAAAAGPDGPGWHVATAVAGLAASAMGFAVRHAPGRTPQPDPADAEAAMPADDFDSSAEGTEVPISDELVNILHRTGRPPQSFTAELHRWVDGQAGFDGVQTFRSAAEPLGGLLGPDALWQALGERDFGSTHWIARLRLAMPGRYRLDFLTGNCRPYRAIACDGTQSTTGYNDKVVTGPVTQPEPDIRAIADPAWLLDRWQLSAAGEVTVAGRRGLRVIARAPEETRAPEEIFPAGPGLQFSPLEVILDPELGIALRQTSYYGSRPATRSELRSVLPDPETTQAGTSDPAAFRIAPEPGMRTVTDSGGLFGHKGWPGPVDKVANVAALAAGGATLGAVAVTGWLEKRRADRGKHAAPN